MQTAYLIAEVIMIPLSGTLARIVSTRVLFSVSAAGFTIASALAATATNIDQMIVYRALQGFIGGGMIPSVFAAAFTIFPPSKRSIVSPIIGLVATLAPTIGPTVGGYLSHAFSWHWLFLVNIVPGIIVTIVTWNFIDFDKPEHGLMKKFDWWGLFSMAVFLGSLEYVLEEGNANDWFSDEYIFMGAIASAIGALIFFYRAFKVEFPIVDLRAFANRNFAFGSLFSFIMGIGLYGLTYLYPLYLGRIRGYDSLMIGETMFVSGLAMFCTAPDRRQAVDQARSARDDGDRLCQLRHRHLADEPLTADWDFYELLVPQILRGCGLMLCMVPINNVALGTLLSGARSRRVRPVQPDPQPRRRRRPGSDQHDPDPAPGRALCPAAGACSVGQPGSHRPAQQHGREIQFARSRWCDDRDPEALRHGAAAGDDPVLHRRLPDPHLPVRSLGRMRLPDQEAAGSAKRRRGRSLRLIAAANRRL